MATWRIADITMHKNHAISLVMEETTADGTIYLYEITKAKNTTKVELFAEFKRQVLEARAIRARMEAIKAQINVNQIEAYLAQP